LNAASQRQAQNLDQLATKLAKFKFTVNSHQNVLYLGSPQGSNYFSTSDKQAAKHAPKCSKTESQQTLNTDNQTTNRIELQLVILPLFS